MDITALERELAGLSSTLTAVRTGECLYCYLVRMLSEFGCVGGHRFSQGWIAAQPRRMPALLRWLKDNGGCCCDCEVVMNVLGRGNRNARLRRLQCDTAYDKVVLQWAIDDDH